MDSEQFQQPMELGPDEVRLEPENIDWPDSLDGIETKPIQLWRYDDTTMHKIMSDENFSLPPERVGDLNPLLDSIMAISSQAIRGDFYLHKTGLLFDFHSEKKPLFLVGLFGASTDLGLYKLLHCIQPESFDGVFLFKSRNELPFERTEAKATAIACKFFYSAAEAESCCRLNKFMYYVDVENKKDIFLSDLEPTDIRIEEVDE